MALRDIFKRKKAETTLKAEKEKKEKKPVEEKPQEVQPPKIKKEGKSGQAYRIIKIPHVTEKATDLAGKNQYVFKVWPGANRVEVKKAIEDIFGVDVISVKIINVPKKKRRLGRITGFRKGYKKAIIRIKEGQKIEVLPR